MAGERGWGGQGRAGRQDRDRLMTGRERDLHSPTPSLHKIPMSLNNVPKLLIKNNTCRWGREGGREGGRWWGWWWWEGWG